MPKIKTHKATAKRFKVTGRGKLRRTKQRRSHLRRKKSNRVRDCSGYPGINKIYRIHRIWLGLHTADRVRQRAKNPVNLVNPVRIREPGEQLPG